VKKVSIVSLGCPKNLVDSERILGEVLEYYPVTFNPDEAQIVLINTCAFLEEARKEGEGVISEFIEKKKKGHIEKIIVLGCYPSLDTDVLKEKFPLVDGFVGTNNLKSVLKAIEYGGVYVDKRPEYADLPRLQVTLSHYSYLKIADGCNHRCAFCLIPKIKGDLHSFDIDFLIKEAKALVENGVKELVLIAQDTTQYGIDLYGRISLIDLLKKIESIDGLHWIRILYTYPSPYIYELVRYIRDSAKVVPYIDMPIQHISDRILRLMQRNSTQKDIEEIASCIKKNGLAFRTSVIAGFPSETEEEFKMLKQFIVDYKVDHLGIFKYSNEKGTKSYSMPQLEENVKDERFSELLDIKDTLASKRSKSFLGASLEFVIDYFDYEHNYFVGRTKFDAPDIDNIVITRNEVLPSQFYTGKVKRVKKYEWFMEVHNSCYFL